MNARANIGIVALGALALATLVASCASTDMTSTWIDPAAKGAAIAKVAVVCLTEDPELRHMAEETTAAQMPGAMPSHRILGNADLKDRAAVKRKLREAGMNGVLVMHVAGVTQVVSAVPNPYGTFDGYYEYANAMAYVPGLLEPDSVVQMVSSLYSLDQSKLLWSGVSQTFAPASAKSLMTDVSKAVAKSLQRERLIL